MSSPGVVVESSEHAKHRMLRYLSSRIGYTTLEQIARNGAADAREVDQRILELVTRGFAKRSIKSGTKTLYKITLKGELAIASTFHASLMLLVGVIALLSAIVSLSSFSIGGALLAFSAGLFAYDYLMFRSRKSLKK
jgi:hypothetical protein